MESSINIEALLASGERINLECKKAQSNVPVDVWKTYSAFANTKGGYIILGVKKVKIHIISTCSNTPTNKLTPFVLQAHR